VKNEKLTLQKLMDISIERSKRWHDGSKPWSVLEWAGAMCGEAGECANAAKKLKRLEDLIPSINHEARHFSSIAEAKMNVVQEVCDTILYAVLVAASTGVSSLELEAAIVYVFNVKSEEYGFPERL
jgi:NTP pyrophosphatase (non-canonical NTP hydrolase)